MVKKHNIRKRLIAGIVAMATVAQAMCVPGIVMAETGTSGSGSTATTLSGIAGYMAVLEHIQSVSDGYGLPSVMISEGDEVYINDELVSSTVVEVTDALVKNQAKIRSQYWLDVCQYATYEEFKAAADALNTYLMTTNREQIVADEATMRAQLIAVRDWFIANNVTVDSATGLYSGDNASAAIGLFDGYIAKNKQLKIKTREIAEDAELTDEERTAIETQIKYEKARIKADSVDSIPITDENANTVSMQYYTWNLLEEINYEYRTLRNSLGKLIGDINGNSADIVDKALETMTHEELSFAYVTLLGNLKTMYNLVTYLTSQSFNLYYEGTVIDTMTVAQYLEHMAQYNVYTIETAEDGTITEEQTTWYSDTLDFVNMVTQNIDVFTVDGYEIDAGLSLLSDMHYLSAPSYLEETNGVYSINDAAYKYETKNYAGLEIKDGSLLTGYYAKRNDVINNIPREYLPVWYLLYDCTAGYAAIGTQTDPAIFEEEFVEHQKTLNGAWDWNATEYTAQKYVRVETEIDGETVIKKEPIFDETGAIATYGKQQEVTPWLDLSYVTDSSDKDATETKLQQDYAAQISTELYRNVKPEDGQMWNPLHPVTYTVTESPDMETYLTDAGYAVEGDEAFKCAGVKITVDRYALDNKGVSEKGVAKLILDFEDEPETQFGLDVKSILNYVKGLEYAKVPASDVENFKTCLAYAGITDEVGQAAMIDAYCQYVSGYNKHNGYAVTLSYVYYMDDLQAAELTEQASNKSKILLTEIPEYSISEYYENKLDLLTVADIKSQDFLSGADYQSALRLLENNPDKLLNKDSDLFSFGTAITTDWNYILQKYAQNKDLATIGAKYNVPKGYTAMMPAYVPVSGRTFDTRYFVKYIPYSSTDTLPEPTQTAFFAVDMVNHVGTDLPTMVDVTKNGADGFVVKAVNSDKTGFLQVFYALDRGVDRVNAAQRMMLPVTQFTITGPGANNVNNSLTVNGEKGTENGYQGAVIGAAVDENGLPTLAWDNISGLINNQDTQDATYSGDIHLWVSKNTADDGLVVADWINDVPDVLKDALASTNTSNGVYDLSEPQVSIEKPTRVNSGDTIVIKSGVTEGTFADWVFGRQLTPTNELMICPEHGLVASTHKHFMYTEVYRISMPLNNGGAGDFGAGELGVSTTGNGGDSNSAGGTGNNTGNGVIQFTAGTINVSLQARGKMDDISDLFPDYGHPVDGKLGNGTDFTQYHFGDGKYYVGDDLGNGNYAPWDFSTMESTYEDAHGRHLTYGEWLKEYNKFGAVPYVYNDNGSLSAIGNDRRDAALNALEGIKAHGEAEQYEITYPDPDNPDAMVTEVLDRDALEEAAEEDEEGGSSEPPPPPTHITIEVPIKIYAELCEEDLQPVMLWTKVHGTTKYVASLGALQVQYGSEVTKTQPDIKVSINIYNYDRVCYALDEARRRVSEEEEDDNSTAGGTSFAAGSTQNEYTLPVIKEEDTNNTGSSSSNSSSNNSSAGIWKPSGDDRTMSGGGVLEVTPTGITYDQAIDLWPTEDDFKNKEYMRQRADVMVGLPDPHTWGIIVTAGKNIYGVVPKVNVVAVYSSARQSELEYDLKTVITPAEIISDYRNNIIGCPVNWCAYVDELYARTIEEEETGEEDNFGGVSADATFEGTTLEEIEQLYKALRLRNSTIATGSVNAMIVEDASKHESYEAVKQGTGKNSTTEGTCEVTLPELTYVPYDIINNISGVTRDGAELEYNIDGTVKTPRNDVFGNALNIHEYRVEIYDALIRANVIPEVLMTYKDSFLDAQGNLADYEDRGALNTLYIAGYNKYAMDLPMYNKMRLTYDVDGTDLKTAGAAEATSKAAKALGGSYKVLYTGTEVTTMVENGAQPQIAFDSYVIDFADVNVGKSWNATYTGSTAYQQVQNWLNTYKGANAQDSDSFEYDATLSTTFNTSAMYEASSNSSYSNNSSTIRVDGKEMKPLDVTQTYTFDLTNANGENNKYALKAEYPITIKNGRVASINVGGTEYILYADGATTTAVLQETAGFKQLKEDHYEIAEAVANMKLAEFATTMAHNEGGQNWKTYEDVSIYTDNSGKSVVDAVGEEKSWYYPNYANASGWYGEDVTTLSLKLYSIAGTIDNEYAYTYKIPIDYGYKSPKNKNDFFKAGTGVYAYAEWYFNFKNVATAEDGTPLGVIDIIGDEGVNRLQKTPEVTYLISNATVNDMTR